MNKDALIKRAEALLQRKSGYVHIEPSEEMKSCLKLYSMVIKIMFDSISDLEGSPSNESLMACTEYRYIMSMGGIGAVCSLLKDNITASSITEQEQKECIELIDSSEQLYNSQIVGV